MSDPNRHCVLNDWGALRVAGRDTVPFLQGQLSNDMQRLSAARAAPAGLHNPQGRVLALAWLRPAPDGVWMMLPASLLTAVATRLSRFVLRSKVTIDELASLRIVGSRGADGRDLQVRESLMETDAAHGERLTTAEWRRLDIADGIAEVVPAISESFVAQMLNLDCIDGISWSKGCYTGQEVIARAHYRGRVKRRMQRFAFAGAAPTPGSTHTTSDGIGVQVVNSEALPQGGCELLGVAPLEPRSIDALPLPYTFT